MADIATAKTAKEKEVDLSRLVADLDERIKGQGPMNDAKGDYNQLCKDQNKERGYHKGAMNTLTKLRKMSASKFQDFVRTLKPGLDILIETRGQSDTPDMMEGGEVVTLAEKTAAE